MHVVVASLHPFQLATLALGMVFLSSGCRHPDLNPPPLPQASASASVSVQPGINDTYLDPQLDPQTWVERFEREGREIYDLRHEIVRTLQLPSGQKVADIGAGSGLFTAEIEAAGFQKVEEFALLQDNYFLHFRKTR